MQEHVRIAVIGGSGLYNMPDLKLIEEREIETPFGLPSSPIMIGELNHRKVAFLARHGKGHRFMPTEINFRANIYALKMLGVEWIISVSAVGSMKEELPPLTMVIPDQFIDRTKLRTRTFFGEGLVAHIGLAEPVCPHLSRILYDAAKDIAPSAQFGGTYLCIEGPQFSTKAESLLYRQWNVDVIGMTNVPEAFLAREAEICYATLAMVTDYDCWHEEEEVVTADMVIERLKQNIRTSQDIIQSVVSKIPETRDCFCARALENAFITDRKAVPESTLNKLWAIVGKYFSETEE